MLTKYLNKVTLGDCLTVLQDIPDNSVDVCFADPPFNLDKKYTSYHDQRPTDQYLKWCEQWLRELVRVTKPTGTILVHNIPRWLTYYAAILNQHAYFRHWIAWDAMSTPLGKTLLPAHYGILYYTKQLKDFKYYDIRVPHKKCRVCDAYIKDYGGKKDQMHPFGTLASDVWTDIHRIKHAVRRDEHPCQLPIPLLERLVLMSSDEGDIVLDPFLGTGTSAIASKAMGRQYIGIDVDPEYVEIANGKLEKVAVSKWNDFYVSFYLEKISSIRDMDASKIFPPQLTSVEKKRMRANGQSGANGRAHTPQLLEKRTRYKTNSSV
ncbi:MAG: restriction endonuclease [Chloroflexi bacterium UTCFX4]|jgi:site-specific DNA-methyltransferase (adenine-specific)|nr:MAG: restriction endonuclease [Chloroflexi bacterium UTCFX4]